MEHNDLHDCMIKVIGVGGAGNNAINRMRKANVEGCEFISVNTDKLVLKLNKAHHKIVIGQQLTRGLGAGANPEVGQKAAQESRSDIEEVLRGTDLLFITCGMGGGTGTGAAPVIASIAKELGILTVAVVTKPFEFEGAHRILNAEIGIKNISRFVDATIVVPNQKLIENTKQKTTMMEAFSIADDVLRQGIQGLTDLIITPMMINLDFADIATVLRGAGIAHMGVGRARGEGRLLSAIKHAVQSPLLETSIQGAQKMIVSIKGGRDLDIHEVNNCGNLIRQVVDPGCNMIYGAHIDEAFNDEVQVIIIATSFGGKTHYDTPVGTPHPQVIQQEKEVPSLHNNPNVVAPDESNLPPYLRRNPNG